MGNTGKLEVIIPYTPWPFQQELHKGMDTHRFSVIVTHRRFGKTVCAINQLIKTAFTCKLEHVRCSYLAPFRNQAKSVAWDYLTRFSVNIPGCMINNSDLSIDYINGARIKLLGADNPDALRGTYNDLAVLDEAAQMKPMVWDEIIRPTLSDRNGKAIFIGTPKGINLFSEKYYAAAKDPQWYSRSIDVYESGVLNDKEIDELKASLPESVFRQEYMCDFTASSENVVITLDIVQKGVEAGERMDRARYYDAPRVLGVDVAGFGNDRSAIVQRQGPMIFSIQVFKQLKTLELAKTIQRIADVWQPDAIFIDAATIAQGCIERLEELKVRNVRPIHFGAKAFRESLFVNKRAEMWWGIREWLEAGGGIPDNLELKTDLVTTTYDYDAVNRIKLEKKEDIKARGLDSPDLADALALTFAEPVQVDAMFKKMQTQAVTDYEILPGQEQQRPGSRNQQIAEIG